MFNRSVSTVIMAVCGGASLCVATPARANLMINAVYSNDITPDARTIIASAIKFYNDNFTGTTSVTLGFGKQAGGGATAEQYTNTVNYADYLKALGGNSTESATDVSALKSLPAAAPVGNGKITLSQTLGVQLGLSSATAAAWASAPCLGLIVNACVSYEQNFITGGSNGGPSDGLFGVTEHEIDEVLGTASALSGDSAPAGADKSPNTTAAASPSDLFRYAASGIRSFSTNAETDNGCPKSPAAYASVDGGITNLAGYNNCNNGGDYGDFAVIGTKQPQVYTGSYKDASSLSLTSPEVVVLDAVGWNIGINPTVARGTPVTISNAVLSTSLSSSGGEDDGEGDLSAFATVPEPASLLILATGMMSAGLFRRRAA